MTARSSGIKRFARSQTAPTDLCDVCSGGLYIYRVQQLAGCHKRPIPFRSTETDVGASLGQPDHPDAVTIRRDHLNTGTSACPDISVGITANTIRRRRLPGTGDIELYESLSIPDGFPVDVPDLDLAAGTSVCDIDLFVVW